MPDWLTPPVLALAVGLFLPPLISYLKNCRWPDWAQVALTLVVSLVVGTLTAVADGSIDPNGIHEPGDVLAASTVAFTAATVVYKAWFQKTRANTRLERANPVPPG